MQARTAIGTLMLASALALPGCGVVYVSPLVSERAEDGVQVVPMTPQSVATANRAPYAPRSLPDVFSQVTGAGSLGGTGGLPQPPVVPDLAPGTLELRPPPPAEALPYRIGVGDVIQLATRALPIAPEGLSDIVSGQVAGNEVRQTYTVRDDGTISVPEVGSVQVGGLTIEQAEERLFEQFLDTGIDPDFSLEIAEFNAQTITVGGQVGRPAVVPVTLNLPTLDEALTAAGGLQATSPEFASIRVYRDGTLYQIPLEAYTADGDLRDLTLAPGDSIFVDSSYDLDRALEYYSQQISIAGARRADRTAAIEALEAEVALRRASLNEARDLFETRAALGAEERDYVYLAGEVGEQQRYPLPYGQQATLADALFDGGGFDSETGNPSQIYVLRASGDPAQPVTAWHLDASNAGNLILATRFQMRPNDIVFVEEQPITRWNRAFQQFFPTLVGTVAGAVD